MTLKAGQQVCLFFAKDVTGTVSLVRDGMVTVTWHRQEASDSRVKPPRMRCSYPLAVAQQALAPVA